MLINLKVNALVCHDNILEKFLPALIIAENAMKVKSHLCGNRVVHSLGLLSIMKF